VAEIQHSPNTRAYDLSKAIIAGIILFIIIALLRGAGAQRAATPTTVAQSPAAPTLTLPEQPNADGAFTFKGTGTPGSKVEVWADGKLLGSTTVGADGTWSLDADLPAGKHTLTTRTVDASGKVLAESAPLSWEAPALAGIAPMLTLPEQPNADGKFSLKGTGTPGSKVEVWADGKLLGSTTVGADGTWSLDADLPAGKHTLTTRTVDASGKVLAESAPLSWEVPALAAIAPMLTLPEQPNADGKFSLKGTGTPGSKVEVWADGKLLGSTTVGADGAWSLDADLPAGKHTLTTRTVDASGKVLAESAPLSWEAPALAVPGAVAPTLTLPEKLEAGKPVKLGGTGTPGAEVEIVEDGKVIGKATVGADGTWTYSYTPSAGEHTLLVRAVGDASLASAPAKLSMPALATAPATPPATSAECGVGEDRGTTYVVARCEYMSLIAKRTGVTLAALIAANPQVTNIDLIYPDQILNLPAR